jgi:hypothetical protein
MELAYIRILTNTCFSLSSVNVKFFPTHGIKVYEFLDLGGVELTTTSLDLEDLMNVNIYLQAPAVLLLGKRPGYN